MMMMSEDVPYTTPTSSNSSTLLPEAIWKNIALNFLSIQDILSLLCVNQRLYKELNHSVTFWNELSIRDGISCYENYNENKNEKTSTTTTTSTEVVATDIAATTSAENTNTTKSDDKDNESNGSCWRKVKQSYLFRCYKNDPSKIGGGVKWSPISSFPPRIMNIDDREGHISCVLKRNSTSRKQEEEVKQLTTEAAAVQKQERTVVITGGFSDDDSIYLIHAGTGNDDIDNAANNNANANNKRWRMEQLQPQHRSNFVYGSTLTPLPTIYHNHNQQKQQQQQQQKSQQQQQKKSDDENDDDNDDDDEGDDDEDKSGRENMETTTKTIATEDDDDDNNDMNSSRSPSIIVAEMRALRFGGFRAGGYSNETQQVSMLTIKEVVVDSSSEDNDEEYSPSPPTRHRPPGFPGDFLRERHEQHLRQRSAASAWVADWSDIPTTSLSPIGIDDLSRAYHSATLLLDRYLVIIGGMKSTASISSEYILDTHTWEWIDCISCSTPPSGRHGHSVILDDKRNRLLLFGGGSGSDLLRSGVDNSEVWELRMGGTGNWRKNLKGSLPWTWNRLHDDCNNMNSVGSSSAYDAENDDSADESTMTAGNNSNNDNNKLAPAETLCLGRCHNCIKISRDTVLLLFGSGRPSSNGMIAYDLTTDTFFRQKQHQQQQSNRAAAAFAAAVPRRLAGIGDNAGVYVQGILPKPRFTGTAAFLEEDGYIITHGGYCSQDSETIGTMDLLDLAPSFRRNKFDGLPIDDRRVSFGEVTNLQAQQTRRNPEAALQQMLETLMNTPREDHQTVARGMLVQMNSGEYPSNGHSLLLMSMIANGNVPLFRSNDEEEEDSSGDNDDGENDDDEYVEEDSSMDDGSDDNDD